ncbi:hypothetical protein CMI37_10330 [Candidatus Pacearchaeota archaeon]|nr:hypothetical protein [Candidatus Pacearchaeota archaeon]
MNRELGYFRKIAKLEDLTDANAAKSIKYKVTLSYYESKRDDHKKVSQKIIKPQYLGQKTH